MNDISETGHRNDAVDLASHAPVIGELIADREPLLPASATALPSIRADAGIAAGRRLAAASMVGRAHQANGTSGQDAYCFTVSHDRSALVLVVCDGLGSRPHSAQWGAELLARFAGHHLSAIGQSAALADGPAQIALAIQEANEGLLACAATQLPAWRPRDLATTLLVARLPLDSLGGPILCGRVGDGEAFTLHADTFHPVFPDSGPRWLNTVTAALPHSDPAAVLETATIASPRGGAFVLCTDGLAGDITNSPGTRAWLARRWSVPCGAHLMMDTLRYRRQGSLDDRTALIVWNDPVEETLSAPTGHPPELGFPTTSKEQRERRRRRDRYRLFGR